MDVPDGWTHETCPACRSHGVQYNPMAYYGVDECSSCKGWGHYFIHDASGAIATYPGGPFLGKRAVAT